MRYRKVKPISIIITKDISACKKLTEKWISFIAEKENISKKAAEKKVLIVTSSPEHKANVLKLDRVDDKDFPTEWILSVSMLTEGWDVKNVFQIVPHEERAFNSKLLIAQVLGRGLRIPLEYKGEQPIVTVFNHDNWARNIKHLVEEVMEIEKRLHIYPVNKEKNYNFDIHQIKYQKKPIEIEVPQKKPYELLKKGYISFSTQIKGTEKETVYKRVITADRTRKKTYIIYKMYPIDKVVQDIWNRLKIFDIEEGTNYSTEFSKERIKKIIRNSLDRIKWGENTVSEENYRKALQAFGVIKRKKAKTLRFELEAMKLEKIKTSQIKRASIGVGAFRRGCTVFFDEDSMKLSNDEDIKELNDLIEDETLPRMAIKEVSNKFHFKTPLNIVIAHSKPERKFIEKLISNAGLIDAWIKSRDTGFYSIEYSWRKGEHPKQGRFNPDFFLKVGNKILVIEIKDDDLIEKIKSGGDMAKEIKAEYKYSVEHFKRLNKTQKDCVYYFNFLTPKDFEKFFEILKRQDFSEFKSQLDAELSEQ